MLTLPWALGVLSPSLSATKACPNSWKDRAMSMPGSMSSSPMSHSFGFENCPLLKDEYAMKHSSSIVIGLANLLKSLPLFFLFSSCFFTVHPTAAGLSALLFLSMWIGSHTVPASARDSVPDLFRRLCPSSLFPPHRI